MNIILIGPPASGKGTQAKLLKEKFGLYHLSTGDLLREISSQTTALANEIKSLIDNGKFVSDDLIIELVKNKLTDTKSYTGVLFDGFPRTVFQAKALKDITNIDYVIEIFVEKDEIIRRVLDRAACSSCGKPFILSKINTYVCDDCGGKITQRVDDTVEIAAERYQDYMLKTYPIIEYFKTHKGYHKVDGKQSAKEVFNQICKIIE